MSGYWATGRPMNATMPTTTMASDSTVANTGRSMKKRANIRPSFCPLPLAGEG